MSTSLDSQTPIFDRAVCHLATTTTKPVVTSKTDSSQAGMDKRVSRFSTYSMTPTLAPSIAPSHLSNASSLTPSEKASPLAQEVRSLTSGLARLDNPKLQSQRYVVSETKKEEIGKIALGAKLERALNRRMSGQDAVMSPKKEKFNEKAA
jgi:hypothetical protein